MRAAKTRERWGCVEASDQRERWKEDRVRVDVAGSEDTGASRQASEASAGVGGRSDSGGEGSVACERPTGAEDGGHRER